MPILFLVHFPQVKPTNMKKLVTFLTLALFLSTIAPTAIAMSCRNDESKSVESRINDCPIPANERATFKGQEIAKIKSIIPTQRSKYKIEIINLKAIPNGVEVYARAWDSKGQIGFGKDGSVDIERFIIINPPVLVDDPQGTIVRKLTDNVTGYSHRRTLREDQQEAILQSLEHTLSVKKEKFDASKIVSGKVGKTTTTVYPDVNPESTSVDGYVFDNSVTPTWSTMRNAAGDGFGDTDTNSTFIGWDSGAQYNYLVRSIFLFDTSAIGDADTINSATLSLYGTVKADPSSNTPDINIYTSTPASNTGLVAGDYTQIGTTAQSSAISYASYSTSGYNDFVLNDLTKIDKTGISKFGARNANKDVANVAPNLGGAFTGLQGYYADQTGTTNDPKLVIEHSAVVATVETSILGLVRAFWIF